MRTTALLASAALGLLALAPLARADTLKVGMTVGSLGNPYFVATVKGARAEAEKLSPGAQLTAVSADYDLGKQSTQIDNFISAGDQIVMLNAVDPQAIFPAVKRAEAAHMVVAGFDVAAAGADVTVETDNVTAGAISCAYLADQIGHKGDVVIVNGPPVSSVLDRVKGCKQALAKDPAIKILSDNQNAQGSRDGGLQVMQGLLTRFPTIAGVFAINDPTAIGADLAAKQLHRTDLKIASVDGSPDIEAALKQSGSLIICSASQDPYTMAAEAMRYAYGLLHNQQPPQKVVLLQPKLITRQNVGSYQGWTSH